MTRKARDAERRRAEGFWESLSVADRFEVGDQLVFGSFNPLDWDFRPVTGVFLARLDALRMLWESTNG